MNKPTLTLALRALLLAAVALGAGGCSLAAYVDRTEIADDVDAAPLPDAGDDTPACSSPAECPRSTNECIEPKCEQGRCNTRIRGGETCSSGRCDVTGRCLPASCFDKIKNGSETDLDCGGPACAPCGNFMKCDQGTDCASRICDSYSHTCWA